MNETEIAWTDATWNPVTGCKKLSPGCKNCYANRFAERFRGVVNKDGVKHPYHQGFDLKFHEKRLQQPLGWKKPSMIFVCSMSDLFQVDVLDSYIDRVFDVMLRATHHTFQVLTKRAMRMREFINARWDKLPAHIWVGVTAEDQERSDQRIPELQATNASVRFVSAEPLIEGVVFKNLTGIHQVIVGGESGPRFRDMDPAWAESIKDQCRAANVPFFFKQHSGFRPSQLSHALNGAEYKEYPRCHQSQQTAVEPSQKRQQGLNL